MKRLELRVSTMSVQADQKNLEINSEFLSLVLAMRKTQIACKFGRKPSAYEKRNVAEHKVDELIIKMLEK
jgi:hypothetical protein